MCIRDSSADATNSFTSLTVDFEAITAHWAESGSCVYSKAGTRQTQCAVMASKSTVRLVKLLVASDVYKRQGVFRQYL